MTSTCGAVPVRPNGRQAGNLGAILLQFPFWFPSGRSKDIHERVGYRSSDDELEEWAPKIAGLAGDARETHVLFSNCYRDYAQSNARQLAALLRT